MIAFSKYTEYEVTTKSEFELVLNLMCLAWSSSCNFFCLPGVSGLRSWQNLMIETINWLINNTFNLTE